ncbi:type III secretion chaperone SycN [Endozoicomonas sp. (ex Bugula neritina AB1)]|nr:type III secretion chaperone SycN [Endozoicomonas sp. (ex Bugula neritina AB1)]
MEWRDDVLAEVGRGMGIEGLDFSGTGVISFEFERMGTLYMEHQEDGVLMYLIRELPAHDYMEVLEKALKLCHYTQSQQFPLQVGAQEREQLFLCIYLANEEFDRPNVETVIQSLTAYFDSLEI